MFNGLAPFIATPAPQIRDGFTAFSGGLDTETPAWSIPAGRCRDALNYEIAIEDGYQDIRGYERFDGQTKPSAASFTVIDVTITGAIAVGNTVTGDTSTATGVVLAIETYTADPTQTYLVLTKVTGAFDEAAEDLRVGGIVQANTDEIGYADTAPTPQLKAQYKNLAADAYRADIDPVPGEDSVWGGFSLAGTKYAIRNKVGGATAGLYKSTAAGWVEIDLGYEVAFTSGGTYEIAVGDTITGATSAKTATVTRVYLASGDWTTSDAAGYLTLSTPSGAFQAENLDVGANLNVATIAGDASAITLLPDGLLDYALSNFADPQGPRRAYCADGVNLGWEFDGTVFAKIRTGMVDDTPDHVAVHKNQLFFSFDGSAQHSGPGDPLAWSPILGAAEIAPGDIITGFQVQPGAEGNAALLIATRNQHHILYGNDVSDWNLIPYRERIGAFEWTLQTLAQTLFLDDRGITDLRTAQTFGNFDHSSLSNRVRTLINAKKQLAVASCVVRDKNQYRLFFSDKTAIYVTMNGTKLKGMMPVELQHQVVTVWSEEDGSGNEEVFFGCDDGYVYQMEKGTSFDGDNIYGFLYLHADYSGRIGYGKGYFGPATVQGKSTGYAEFDLGYALDFGNTKTPQPNNETAVVPSEDTQNWDTGLSWDTGVVWDQSSLQPAVDLDFRGEGENVGWVIQKDSDYFEPLLLTGVHYGYMLRHRIGH